MMSAHIDSTIDKENVGPAGKPARLQQGAGLSSGGRRVLARRDNLLPAEGLSTDKYLAPKEGLKLWKQVTPQSTARLAPTPAMAQVGLPIFQDEHSLRVVDDQLACRRTSVLEAVYTTQYLSCCH